MAKFRCPVCGYIHEGDTAPERCPQCKVPGEKFIKLEENEDGPLQFADEHVLGVAKNVQDPEILNGLHSDFIGECTEVGMYLAMSRQADREGYPEIAEAFKRYAWEEAEHAACEGKKRIATQAKQQNLDAIHDTVHEMAKDEARHGKGFEGLYNRYFKK